MQTPLHLQTSCMLLVSPAPRGRLGPRRQQAGGASQKGGHASQVESPERGDATATEPEYQPTSGDAVRGVRTMSSSGTNDGATGHVAAAGDVPVPDGDRRPLDGGESTWPATATGGAPSRSDLLVIRWVFPHYDTAPTPLDRERVLLGRGESCDRELPGRETSRHHAEIGRQGPVVYVRDLGSTNGVYLNGRRVADGPLEAGDVLRLGEWIGVVFRPTSNEPAALSPPRFRTVAERFFIGPALAPSVELAERAAASELPVVLCGETGTGKEHMAQGIHRWSGRPGRLVAINCAALPEPLAEAELFGHARGAFTGAVRSSEGHLRAADQGTLLLDEVSELPLPAQAKLLRALESGEIVPLGESQPASISTRIVAATQQPLPEAVEEGRFRADLLARLDGVTIHLPPLRQRVEELGYLLDALLTHHAGGKQMAPATDPRLVEALCLHDFPFNVRELDLLVRRLLALHGHERRLERSHLPETMRPPKDDEAEEEPDRSNDAPASSGGADRRRPASSGWQTQAPQRDADDLAGLVEALRRTAGNVTKAAEAVGLSRQRAYRLMNAAGDVDLDRLRSAGVHRSAGRGGAG